MNVLFMFIILLVLIGYFTEQWLGYLNHKSGQAKLPDILNNIFSPERYKTYLKYEFESYKFTTLVSLIKFLLSIFMLLCGFILLDNFVSGITENQVFRGLIFFGILGLVTDLLFTPFDIYDTFVIEEKFGFNKTTPGIYLSDKLKTYLIAAIVGGGMLSLIIWFYQVSGNNFWWIAWAVISGFSVFMAMFYSSLIVPLFNKQTPLQSGLLRERLNQLATDTGFMLKDIYVIDGSKRSTKANAYFAGLGKKRRIVLYDRLIEEQTVDEIAAVMAHEIGHYKLNHIQKSILIGIFQTGIMLWLFSLLVHNSLIYESLGAVHQNFHLGLVIFMILYSPFSMMISIGMNSLSRKFEFQADKFSSGYVDSMYLISALKKLASNNLTNLTPHKLFVKVYHSHPPLLARIQNLIKIRN